MKSLWVSVLDPNAVCAWDNQCVARSQRTFRQRQESDSVAVLLHPLRVAGRHQFAEDTLDN